MTRAAGAPIPAADVALVIMPYAAIERPSIALSILKARLSEEGITSTVVYGNLRFAEDVSVQVQDIVGKTHSHSLGGEWTFAKAAFPEFECDEDAYFEHVGPGLNVLLPLVWRHGGTGRMRDILVAVRERATAFVDRLARELLAAGPRIVGCSSTFQQHCASLALLRRIKELDPAVATVIGGANCETTMGLATHRECSWIDYVVSGEAEESFPALCRLILEGGAAGPGDDLPQGVIGPVHRRQGYPFSESLPRGRLEEMRGSPCPDYEDYFRTLMESPAGLYVRPGLLVESSRGCWWGAVSHCTFCGLNGTSMKYRSKDPARVVDELAMLSQRWGIKTFEVVDNILDMKYFTNVLPMLEERADGYDIFFETKANLGRKHLRQLSAAGVRWLQPGIETLDDHLLRLIAKGTTTKQNLQLLKWAQDYGIYVLWIMLYDIPGDDDARYAKMARFVPLLTHLQAPSGFSFIQYNRFSPYWQRPEDWNLRLEPDRSYRHVYPWSRASLDDFAYFFDDYSYQRRHFSENGFLPGAPGLCALHEETIAWQVAWQSQMDASAQSGSVPRLSMQRLDDALVIRDTRPCRVADEFVLEGLDARVYDACDKAQNANGVRTELAARLGEPPEDSAIVASLERLAERKLLLALDDWYFSLATSGEIPFANIINYPGGRLRTVSEALAAELYMEAGRMFGYSDYPV